MVRGLTEPAIVVDRNKIKRLSDFESIFSVGLVFLLGSLAMPDGRAMAATTTYVWNASSGTAWSATANWWGGVVPSGPGSIALFDSGSYTNQPSTGGTDESVGAIWDNGSGTLTIGGAGVLNLTGTTVNFPDTGIELDSGAGSVTISAPIGLRGPQQWINNSSNVATISGVISGSAGSTLTAAGLGIITLGTGTVQANTFSGNLTVASGTLQANGIANSTNPTSTCLGNTQLSSRTITVNSGAVLQFTQGNVLGGGDTVVQTPLIINGGLVNNTDSGENNVLGPVTLSGGTLTGGIGPSGDNYLTWQFTAGSVTVNGNGPSLISATSLTGTGYGYNLGSNPGAASPVFSTTFNVALTGTGGTISSNPDVTVAATLADLPGAPQGSGSANYSAGLVKIGPGTMLLLGSDTYTGITIVNGGVLELGNTAALLVSTFNADGAGTLSFGTLASATFGGLQGAAGSTLALTNSAGTLPVALTVGQNNNSTTFSGSLTDGDLGGSLTKVGTGTLMLTSNASTFTGNVVVSGGTLQANNGTPNSTNPTSTCLGNTQLSSRTITVNTGAVLQFTHGNVLGGGDTVVQTPLIINGGLVNNTDSGENNVLGPVTLSGGTLTGGIGPSGDNA